MPHELNQVNLYSLPKTLPDNEWIESLCHQRDVRIRRIVSHGNASPPGFWYDQNEFEWVAVLQGKSEIEYDDGTIVKLDAGDCLLIPPHRRHRVAWTATGEPTIWLAVFFGGSSAE